MRIFITCGGTGGHIFPAISLAQELKSRNDYEIIFVADDSVRARVYIRDAGFECITLAVPKMPYGLSMRWPSFFFNTMKAQRQAADIIAEMDPHIVIGFGAYVSGPVVAAAGYAKKRILIHEQNVDLGRANKLLIDIADKVCFGFYNRLIGTSTKYVLTGNPVRQELVEDFKSLTRRDVIHYLGLLPSRKTILVIGGSSGATAINRLFADMSFMLNEEQRSAVQIIHLTGYQDEDSTLKAYNGNSIHYLVKGFYARMGLLYKAADLVVSRAGAATISEICLYGIPALFIPYPGAGSHQLNNARAIEKRRAAMVLDQDEITPEVLREYIFDLLGNPERMDDMSTAMRSFSMSKATAQLADTVEELINA